MNGKTVIALAGNPNCGKTTLFNALTGANQYVGNWPGVTVEKKEGRLKGHEDVIVEDLPGIYSLSPYTLEEVVSRNYLTEEKPDVILNIVDGTNLERNLYLTTQLAEIGIPMVLAVNMMDLVQKRGDSIDFDQIGRTLGCRVVNISALKQRGTMDAAEAAVEAAASGVRPTPVTYSEQVEKALSEIAAMIEVPEEMRRFYAVKVFERDDKAIEKLGLSQETEKKADAITKKTEAELDDDAESIITNERYVAIEKLLKDGYRKQGQGKMTLSDQIDRIVTNRWLAIPIFLVVMWIVYYFSIQTVGTWATDWTNDVLFGEIVPGFVGGLLASIGVAEGTWLYGLIMDGIVAGVGAVLGFVPQMLVLFFFLAFLEGCGYMARIAFIMDRIFRKFGLSGKSFIPMMIGTGCGVPGIMASRTIENERDRRMTIMTTTFIPCGAKLPVISLIAGAMFDNSAWVGWSIYFLGIAAIVISGIILKKTKRFAGEPAPFVMELPEYHMPTLSSILHSMWERGWSFIKKAGTIITLATILVWFLSNFGFYNGSFGILPEEDFMEHSLLAGLGNAFAWLFIPLGWGKWKPAVATLTGLIAKENVVGTFGVLYKYGEISEEGQEIWANLRADFIPIAAYSFLAFNMLCAPCFAAIGAIRREMNSTNWTLFAVGYECLFAYAIALIIYQIGGLLLGQVGFSFFTVLAVAVLATGIWLLVRPYKEAAKLEAVRA
ncbi:MAG: ferrous iron transport protein B [Solobacterium sp.]|nr:ferrous iron transport protein B [Solobacterium sp.]